MAKKKKRKDGIAFSTGESTSNNPFSALSGLSNLPAAPSNSTEKQGAAAGKSLEERANMSLRVFIDRKYRRGKEVTLITGWEGDEQDMQDLAKLLKTKCGVGGSAKNGEIVIQGNKRDQVMEILAAEGYYGAKKSGG